MNRVMRDMRRKIVWDLYCIDKEKYNVYVLAEIFSSSRQSILRDLSKYENVKKKRVEKLKKDFQPKNKDLQPHKDFSIKDEQ